MERPQKFENNGIGSLVENTDYYSRIEHSCDHLEETINALRDDYRELKDRYYNSILPED